MGWQRQHGGVVGFACGAVPGTARFLSQPRINPTHSAEGDCPLLTLALKASSGKRSLLALLLLFALVQPAAAQRLRNADVLGPGYFQALSNYYTGDYADAVTGFRDAVRGAMRLGDTRWIDSIAYHAMAGESCYQTGQLGPALEHFGFALQYYVQYSDWMQQVQFPRAIGPRTAAIAPAPWGQSGRRFRIGQYPEKFNIARGRTTLTQVGNDAIIQPGEMLLPLHAAELVRTTTLAIRRRRELLGPVAAHDRLLQDVVGRLSGRPGQNGPLSEAWIDLQLGVGYAATGRTEQAATALTRSLVIGGEFDHPLTCVALLELGRLAAEKGDFPTAAGLFAEASYSAFQFSQPDVVEEALRQGAILHMLSGAKGIYPPLAAATDWAHSKRLRSLQATLLLCAAENAVILGDQRQAAAALGQVSRAIPRRDLALSLVGARFNYLSALAAYQRRQPKLAEPALAAALSWEKKGSLKLFQTAMVDQFYRDGLIRDREALEMFSKALEEPDAALWRSEPMEAIATLVVPQDAAFEHWLEAAVGREDWGAALEVGDRIRRRRFYATLPLGGRLLSLRYMLEGPESALPGAAVLQRNELLNHFPLYRQQVRDFDKLSDQLQALPPMPEDREQVSQQMKVLADMARLREAQDGTLLEMALRREPSTLVFPPQRSMAEVQQRMQPRQAILVFHATSRALYGFLVTGSRTGAWKVQSPDAVRKQLVSLLRALGHFDQNREVDAAVLADPTWRGEAAGLLTELMRGSRIDLGQGIDELVIVPDDFLWYVPFEALQIGPPNKTEMLLSKMRIRYAPTLGLAVPDGTPRRQGGATGVVAGSVFPHEPEELSADAVKRLKRTMPQAATITRLPPIQSGLLARRFDNLLVLDDVGGADEQAPYQLAPLRLDRGKPGSRLEDWLSLPPRGPEAVLMPGFHTPAENAFKKPPRGMRLGDDLFLNSCALMASGARTVMLSRWRTGGQTCNELAVELLRELPNTSAADAWQRAVEVARQTPLDLTLEPRVKASKDAATLTADHPFLWAGYVVIDTGTDPKFQAPKADPKPAAPAN